MNRIAASILAADFLRLGEEIRRVERSGVDCLHIDIMDGHYVPNLTMGPDHIRAMKAHTGLELDVHLMVSRPENFIKMFGDAGADALTVHAEAATHAHRVVQEIKAAGMRAGVALNPSTPLCHVELLLPDLDLLLLMTVNPGFGGQRFIPAMLGKIRDARRMLDECGSRAVLCLDGGVTLGNAAELVACGARTLIAGSAIFGAEDPARAVAAFRAAIGGGAGAGADCGSGDAADRCGLVDSADCGSGVASDCGSGIASDYPHADGDGCCEGGRGPSRGEDIGPGDDGPGCR